MKNIMVITGASSGMGKDFVKQVEKVQKVDEIWVLARREDRLIELSKEVETKIVPIAIDLSDMEQIKIYSEKLEKECPNVVLLANCSGFGKFEHYENIPLETNLNMIDLNVKAVVAMTNYTLPYMTKGARIVNFASCSAFQPIPYINIYASTKAFLLSYSRALNVELKYRGISVTAVCPFWTKTEFFNRAVNHDKKDVIINYAVIYQSEKVVAKAIKDAFKRKDMSVYGGKNNFQRMLVKLFPHKFVMKVWMNQQKFDGTPNIR
ncbi:MAG: SDR family NAD(P)-dependent oxidoreductase [Clostridia bacterium]|nr:SDR family NAD(P)-dependent oxidoreductase [Clostridia bacterium]